MSDTETTDADLLEQYHEHMRDAQRVLDKMGTTGGLLQRSHYGLQLLVENEHGEGVGEPVDLTDLFHTGDGSEMPTFGELESEFDIPDDDDATQ